MAQRSGPTPRNEEALGERQVQRQRSMRGEAQERGPANREAQEILDRQLRRRLSPDFADAQGPTGRGPARPRPRRAPTPSRGRGGGLQSLARPTTPLGGGDRLRRPHARERPVLPDENWAVRTLWDVENEDVNDRTYLFDAGPMDYQCGWC